MQTLGQIAGKRVKIMTGNQMMLFVLKQYVTFIECLSQTQGLGTALKILFSERQIEAMPNTSNTNPSFQLSRQEIVSLFNAFGRYVNIYFCLDIFSWNVFFMCLVLLQDLHKCQRAGELSVAVVKSQTVTVKILHSATVKNLTYINRTRRTCFGLNHCFQNVSEVLYQLYTDCSFIP